MTILIWLVVSDRVSSGWFHGEAVKELGQAARDWRDLPRFDSIGWAPVPFFHNLRA